MDCRSPGSGSPQGNYCATCPGNLFECHQPYLSEGGASNLTRISRVMKKPVVGKQRLLENNNGSGTRKNRDANMPSVRTVPNHASEFLAMCQWGCNIGLKIR
jgi:hypothetical protein